MGAHTELRPVEQGISGWAWEARMWPEGRGKGLVWGCGAGLRSSERGLGMGVWGRAVGLGRHPGPPRPRDEEQTALGDPEVRSQQESGFPCTQKEVMELGWVGAGGCSLSDVSAGFLAPECGAPSPGWLWRRAGWAGRLGEYRGPGPSGSWPCGLLGRRPQAYCHAKTGPGGARQPLSNCP